MCSRGGWRGCWLRAPWAARSSGTSRISRCEACGLLREYGQEAKILAGGTDLLVRFRSGAATPQHVVNIKKIPGLGVVEIAGGGVRIGAAVTMNEAEKALASIPSHRVLAEALHGIGSYQIRNRATVAGNLCNASPAADSVPALLVLEAMVEIAGPDGERAVAAADFCTGPGRTVLMPGEWVTGLKIPAVKPGAAGIYLKHSRRRMVDLATVGVAAIDAGTGVRIALAAVAPRVFRAKMTEDLLRAEGLTEDSIVRAASLTARSAAPISDIRASREYRLHIVEVLTLRALRFLLRQRGVASC